MTVPFGVLRQPAFRRLWIASSVSAVGDGLLPIGVAAAAIARGHPAEFLAAVLTARALASTVAALPAGLITDRFTPRTMLVIGDLVRVAALVGLLEVEAHGGLLLVGAFAFLYGVGDAAFQPASDAALPGIVEPEDIQSANALSSLGNRVGLVLGPAVGGALVVAEGARLALVVDAVSFVLSALAISGMPSRSGEERSGLGARDMVEGYRAIRTRRWVTTGIVMQVFHLAACVPVWQILLPVLAAAQYGRGAYGAILTSWGIGAVIGAAVTLRLRLSRHAGTLALAGLVPFGLCLVVLAIDAPLWIVVVAHVAGGAGLQLFGVLWVTALQRDLPSEVLGRVFSLEMVGGLALAPVGLALVAPAAHLLGPTRLMLAAAAAFVTSCLLPLLSPSVRALRSPGHASAPAGLAPGAEPASMEPLV